MISGRRQMRHSKQKQYIILLMGILYLPVTPETYFEKGRAPSLLMANTILVVTVR